MLRIIAAVIGYVFGWVPLGNTGGANVSPLKPMPVPPEFAAHFEGFDPRRLQRQRLILLVAIASAATLALLARDL